MSIYTVWSVVFGEQPSAAKWNLLGSNMAIFYQQLVDGWIQADETWLYASADSPTFTFTVAADVTAKYQPGMRVRLKQGGAYKYFIITAVSTYSGGLTTITIYGGTDYTLTNAVITENYYSSVKAPFGFPLSPLKWAVETTDANVRSQATPVQNTWYNMGSVQIIIPIGIWRVQFQVCGGYYDTNTADSNEQITLSSANNSESDAALTAHLQSFGTITASAMGARLNTSREKVLNLAAKATYYLNARTINAGQDTIEFDGTLGTTVIRAICAYL